MVWGWVKENGLDNMEVEKVWEERDNRGQYLI